jgi:hypothetical protein
MDIRIYQSSLVIRFQFSGTYSRQHVISLLLLSLGASFAFIATLSYTIEGTGECDSHSAIHAISLIKDLLSPSTEDGLNPWKNGMAGKWIMGNTNRCGRRESILI